VRKRVKHHKRCKIVKSVTPPRVGCHRFYYLAPLLVLDPICLIQSDYLQWSKILEYWTDIWIGHLVPFPTWFCPITYVSMWVLKFTILSRKYEANDQNFLEGKWLLFNTKWTFFSYIMIRASYINKFITMLAVYQTNNLSWIFTVLGHWNNNPRINVSLHLDTLS
jgi:hypothetical protein